MLFGKKSYSDIVAPIKKVETELIVRGLTN